MTRTPPPVWFWLVTALLLVWETMGVWSWWEHVARGAYGMGQQPSAYDLAYYAALPGWYVWVFAVSVFPALAGGLLAAARRRQAWPLYLVSLIATAAMFGWALLATDLIAQKGIAVAYFPAFIVASGVFELWWAGLGIRRGWLT